jgi:hypothetical protein
MSILIILLMLVLFGFGAFAPAPEAARVEAPAPAIVEIQAPTGAPEPLTIEGQPATALAVESTSGEATYAVAGTNLYRAGGDGGWEATGTSANLETTIVDSRNPDALWAGTGMECYRGGGVSLPLMHSTDAGATWAEAGPAGFVPLASWDPGDIVIAQDCSGLQVTRDGGASWAMPEGLPLGSQVTAFAVESTPESAAGLRVLVGVTGEGGTSELYRVELSDPAAAEVDGPLATWWGHAPVAVADDGATLIGAPQGVLRSDDGGETWETLRTGLESTTLEQDPIEVFPPNLEPGSFGLAALATPGEDIYVAGVDGVYRLSSDGWEKIVDLDVEVTALAIQPGGGALLVQTADGSVLRIELAEAGM